MGHTYSEASLYAILSAKQLVPEEVGCSFMSCITEEPASPSASLRLPEGVFDEIIQKRKRDTDESSDEINSHQSSNVQKRLRRNALVPNGAIAEVVKDVCLQFQMESIGFSDSGDSKGASSRGGKKGGKADQSPVCAAENQERRNALCPGDADTDPPIGGGDTDPDSDSNSSVDSSIDAQDTQEHEDSEATNEPTNRMATAPTDVA